PGSMVCGVGDLRSYCRARLSIHVGFRRAGVIPGFVGHRHGTGRRSAELVISLYDLLHQVMAHYVALVEVNEGDAFDLPDHINRFDEARTAARGQVDLRNVSRNYGFGIEAQTRE